MPAAAWPRGQKRRFYDDPDRLIPDHEIGAKIVMTLK